MHEARHHGKPSASLLPHCAVLFVGAILIAGCNRKVDSNVNYTHALNAYYEAHPSCLWPATIKFPVQADTDDLTKTSGYDALVDQGLLVRTTAEKKKLIIASKQVNNYDLSPNGRAVWTADPQQPGFGNFCYGHRSVSAIDASSPASDQLGATTQVDYHYSVVNAPAWATAAETQTAYPNVRADLAAPQAGHASLVNTASGWQVSNMPGSKPTDADSKIVE